MKTRGGIKGERKAKRIGEPHRRWQMNIYTEEKERYTTVSANDSSR
jgi:hypothetical protein